MTRVLAVVVWAVVGAATGAARADDRAAVPPESKATGDAAEAKRLFDGGVAAYDSGDYDVAIVRFRAAYARTRAPALLFNIAQALRRKGDCPGAMQAYDNFKSLSPDRASALDVDKLIAEMKTFCPAEAKTESDVSRPNRPLPVAKPPIISISNATPITPPAPAPPTLQRSVAWGALGLAVGLAAFGGYNTYAAHRTDQRLSDLTDAGTPWNAYGAELEAEGGRQRDLAKIGFGAAGAALAVGVGLLVWDWWQGHQARTTR